MGTPRTAYKVDVNHRGSDVTAETAAALAATSFVFHQLTKTLRQTTNQREAGTWYFGFPSSPTESVMSVVLEKCDLSSRI